jgi:hypothetical protein
VQFVNDLLASLWETDRSAPETPGEQHMTTMFPLFFGVPQAAIRFGRLKEISGVTLKL